MPTNGQKEGLESLLIVLSDFSLKTEVPSVSVSAGKSEIRAFKEWRGSQAFRVISKDTRNGGPKLKI